MLNPTELPATGSFGRRAWWGTFLLFTVLGGLWAVASPLYSVPDEPAHTTRAVAAARGQILPGERTAKGYSTYVEVPEVLAGDAGIDCYIFAGNVGADCATPLKGSQRPTKVETNAGLYPPAFYVVDGLPSRLFPSTAGVYLMRVLNAALCAALLASALASALLLPACRLAVAGIALAVTPMVLFLAGSVNPNGVEIAAAVCFWTAGAVLLGHQRDGHRDDRTRLLVRVAVSATALAVSRLGSPLWVALVILTLVAWAGWGPALRVARDRRAWVVGSLVGLASLSTVVWVRRYGTLDHTLGGAASGQPLGTNIRLSLGNAPAQIDRMIGVFGWLDTGPATLSVYLWLFAVGTLLLVGLASAGPRQAAVLVLLVAAVVLVPVALEAPRAATQGFPWQGRYTLPLAVGVPILAALQADGARGVVDRALPDGLIRRLSLVLLSLFGVGQLYAHVWATRRYTAGVDGPLDWLSAPGWTPPVPTWALLAGFVVALTAAAGWLQLLAIRPADRIPAPSVRSVDTDSAPFGGASGAESASIHLLARDRHDQRQVATT